MTYVNTFIAVAPDTQAVAGTVPAARGDTKTVAQLEYELIASSPYTYTQEDVQFAVHVARSGLDAKALRAREAELRSAFFSKPMACLRASPLPKSYGWGLHFDAAGKVALIGMQTPEYRRLREDPALRQTTAMRNRRAPS